MADTDSTLCDDEEYTLKIEAESVVNEIAYAVKCVQLSDVLPSADNLIYLNLRTKENQKYCVQLSTEGFQIVGHDFDSLDNVSNGKYFETIYSLLDNVSPEYRNSFGDVLLSKLQKVQEQQEQVSEKDDLQ
ncbi:GSK3-beta interaction protein-like [Octopus sinensis]|uniref:GSK3-beta interaction protein-like n=1 Tax=Octopus sinensis TaxID=2607531 RepID=A0A6P7S6L9_9MOLL|nr:GSK3-beta interaction protein-like [Octopus sinensis]